MFEICPIPCLVLDLNLRYGMYFPNCSAVPSYYVEMLEVIHEPAADTKLFHLVDVSCHHLRRPLVIRAHPRSGLDDDRGVNRLPWSLRKKIGRASCRERV